MWETVEPLGCTLATYVRLYINSTSIKKKGPLVSLKIKHLNLISEFIILSVL